MATLTVPGADPANNDKLSRGSWAEHSDGSLIYVKDIDVNDRVIFEIYDFANEDHPIFYPQAMSQRQFEKTFSYDPKFTGPRSIKWTWHDKTRFPWERVMRLIKTPVPVFSNTSDYLSAAAQAAASLNFRFNEVLTQEHVVNEMNIDNLPGLKTSRTIFDRLKRALNALVE